MSKPDVLEGLIVELRSLAGAHGKATLEGDSDSANRVYDQLVDLLQKIAGYGVQGQAALRRLISDPDLSVATWAATYSLGAFEAEALEALDRVGRSQSILGFDAKMVAKMWREKQR